MSIEHLTCEHVRHPVYFQPHQTSLESNCQFYYILPTIKNTYLNFENNIALKVVYFLYLETKFY